MRVRGHVRVAADLGDGGIRPDDGERLQRVRLQRQGAVVLQQDHGAARGFFGERAGFGVVRDASRRTSRRRTGSSNRPARNFSRSMRRTASSICACVTRPGRQRLRQLLVGVAVGQVEIHAGIQRAHRGAR